MKPKRLAEPIKAELISITPEKRQEKKPTGIIALNFLSSSSANPGFNSDFQLSWSGAAVREILGNPVKAYVKLASCNVCFIDNGATRYNSEALCRLGMSSGNIPQNAQKSATSFLNVASGTALGSDICFSSTVPYREDSEGDDLNFVEAINGNGMYLLIRPTVNVGFIPPASYTFLFQGCIKFKVTNF